MIWTLPNILTMGRVLAAPALALVFVVFDRPTADLVAFALFAAAAITDFFDGWLARRLGQTSEFGRMLDPIADKVMVLTALALLVSLTGQNWTVLIPVAVIILREVLVSGLREFLAGRLALPATLLAKWKTTAQMVAIGTLLLAGWVDETMTHLFHALGPGEFMAALSGEGPDPHGLRMLEAASPVLVIGGFGLLWIAAILTAITGWDYFSRGVAYILAQEEPR